MNLDWTTTPSYCSITYYLYDQGTTNIADGIFSVNGATYEVLTADKLKVANYALDIYGEITGVSSSTSDLCISNISSSCT